MQSRRRALLILTVLGLLVFSLWSRWEARRIRLETWWVVLLRERALGAGVQATLTG